MEKKEWFAEWFDTTYYHTLYKDRDYLEAKRFIAQLVDFLELPEGAKILDLACGKGRHSVMLNALNYNVTGVDLSPCSIAEAKKSETSGLSFLVHDMRDVLNKAQFNAVFNLFTSFGYFDSLTDNLKVMSSVHQMLVENGIFVIDFMNAERVIRTLVEEEIKEVDGIRFHIKRRFDGDHIFKDISFSDEGKNFAYTERVQALKLEHFNRMLTTSDFEILRTFGDFDLNEFNPISSDRLILIAQKK